MEIFDFSNPLYDALAAPVMAVLVILAVLTMRSISQRDRAMTFGRANADAETRRRTYEQRWRNGGMRSA
ncbi:MAG: hypothetical protein KDB47_01215 [Mycobacterium sp.]|nr:hypothetical protein [Mycobacterium sp.]